MPGLWAFLGSYACLWYRVFPELLHTGHGGDVAMLTAPFAWATMFIANAILAAISAITLTVLSAVFKFLPFWLYSLIMVPMLVLGVIWPLLY